MQQQQPGTVTPSRISSLLISRRLELLRDIQFGLPTLPETGVATQTFSDALRAPVAESPFLNF